MCVRARTRLRNDDNQGERKPPLVARRAGRVVFSLDLIAFISLFRVEIEIQHVRRRRRDHSTGNDIVSIQEWHIRGRDARRIDQSDEQNGKCRLRRRRSRTRRLARVTVEGMR